MSFFACAIHREGGSVPLSFRTSLESSPFSRTMELEWYSVLGFTGAIGLRDGVLPASIAHEGNAVAIGNVRLDNRCEIARWCADDRLSRSDLELALRFVLRDDGARAGQLLGDFAFVVWHPTHRSLLAIRDSFGVRKLFHSTRGSAVSCFASHASALADEDRYDVEYLVDRVCQTRSDPTRTVFASVSAVPPASVLRVRDGTSVMTTYWSAMETQRAAGPASSTEQQCEHFGALLVESIRLRISDSVPTWSHLSGGLDSSSVVSVAQWLAARNELPNGLAGTLTYTDSLGTSADEREFSDAVVEQYGVRNELVPHRAEVAKLFEDPPLLDQPNYPYAMAARDRAAATLIHDAGGRVLLTGEGGDSLVAGTMFFFADWLVTGRFADAIGEMAHRAALGRVSFWQLAYENALLPLMPVRLRRYLTRTRIGSTPPWIPTQLSRRYDLAVRSAHDRIYAGRIGRKYADAVAFTIGSISAGLPLGPRDELLDVRHPYLYRPLVELALCLPPELCVRPHARKWILREAMRGILPEKVRTRVGKGALDGVAVWSMRHDAERIDLLLRDPILADLGCIDVGALKNVVDDIQNGTASHDGWRDRVNTTLDVEMWLRLRSGRWAARDTQSSRVHMARSKRTREPSTGQWSRSIV